MTNSNTNKISQNLIFPVILSGGSGKRLWPLSRSSLPKQYLSLNSNSKYSLIQETYLRLRGIQGLQSPLIICNEEQRFIVAEQMRAIDVEPKSILLEPFGRNTAPAITLAALIAIKENDDPLLLVLASDHKVEKDKEFRQAIDEGLIFAKDGRLVTFGIKPNSSDTGFGYIESLEELSSRNKSSTIKRFIEKPNQQLSKELIKDKRFSWNSGIFLFKASSIISELKKYQPKIVEICEKSLEGSSRDLYFQRVKSDIFKACPNIPIDIAVMEKTQLGTVISLDVGWNDLGSWERVWESSLRDSNNNTLQGKTFVKNVKNSYIRSESRLVVGLNLENIFVIETNDAILVSNKSCSENVKEIVDELHKNNFRESFDNKKVYRPWGFYISIAEGPNWQVKKINLNPFSSISLQLHHRRSEHWVIVNGTALVEINSEQKTLHSNESIFVPKGIKHRVSNASKEPLTLIEVQSGDYLGEDDILRFEDNYGRAKDE